MTRYAWIVATLLLGVAAWGQGKAAAGKQDYLTLAGARLYYEECGTGPNLVLLHDGLLHSVAWDDMWPALCGKYHVVRYDRRGYGRSEVATAPFSPVDDLLLVMGRARMERAILVGSSSGTAIALDFAIAHPERVEGLFLIGPVVHGMRSSDYFLQRGNVASAPLANGDVKAAAENWSKDPFQVSGERPEARKKIFDTLVANPQNFRVPGQFELRPSPPTVTRLAEVQAPTLAIVGDGDIADVHAFAGAVQAAVPIARREVWKGDGHLIQMEKPADLTARLDAFVAVAERKIVTVSPAILREYVGTYALGNPPAKIELEKDRLVLEIGGDVDVPLFAASESLFFVRTTGTELEFERNAAGKVTAVFIHNPDGGRVRCPRT